MKKSYLNCYEALLKQSLAFPDLVNKLEQKNNSFVQEFTAWLKESEEILRKNNCPECSELAGLRSKLLLVNYTENSKVPKRKQLLAQAADILYPAQNTLLAVQAPLQARIEEARTAVNQLLGIAYQANMIKWVPGSDFNLLILNLWQQFSSHEQLKGVLAKILTAVSKTDGLRLIADEIDLE